MPPKPKSGAKKRKEKDELIQKIKKATKHIYSYAVKLKSSTQVSNIQIEQSNVIPDITKSRTCKRPRDQDSDSEIVEPPCKITIKEECPEEEIKLCNMDFFTHAAALGQSKSSADKFWDFHPKQPNHGLPFNPQSVYYRRGFQGKEILRKWVTYNEENKTLHC